jgi:hypothetical protein
MKRFFTIEDVSAKPDGLRIGPPQVKIVRHQMAPSSGLFSWRRMGVRLVLLRAKRRAKHVD